MIYRNKLNGNLYELISTEENGLSQVIDLTDNQRCSIRNLDNTNLFERVPEIEQKYALKLEELKAFIKGAKDFYTVKK
jgi:phage host-nuclease inhibitor protein Gam